MGSNDLTDLLTIGIAGYLFYYLILQGNIKNLLGGINLGSGASGGSGGGGRSGADFNGVGSGGRVSLNGNSFTAVGDIDKNKETCQNLAGQNAAIILLCGDMAYSGSASSWAKSVASPIVGKNVLWTRGNHDGTDYLGIFNQDEVTTSKKVGNALFVSCDTEEMDTSAAEAEIRKGMDDKDIKWIIPIMHKVVYGCPNHHGEEARSFHTMFKKYTGKIKLVLQGHNHNYVRMKPLNGITYVQNGEGGRKEYNEVKADSNTAKAFAGTHGILHGVYGASSISVKFLSNDGKVMDSFTIT